MSHPLTVLFATMTGNAEDCALRASKKLQDLGHATRMANMRDASPADLGAAKTVLILVSTWGAGEPPDDAIPYWEKVKKLPADALAGVRYAVFALGDANYSSFCGFGKECDEVFERLGAAQLLPRIDCDLDHDGRLDGWIEQIAAALDAGALSEPSRG